jgi:predicted Fe-Mo cluster-binding NifX family protein
MKIIIPTNDRETIAVHTGRCKEFGFYEIENGNMVLESFVPIRINIRMKTAVERIPENIVTTTIVNLWSCFLKEIC